MPSEASSVEDFTNSGKRSFFGIARLLAAREHHELRRRHAMIGEQLLGEHLVARQQHAARIAPGVGLVHEFQECDDVLIVGDDAVEFLQQVEHDVRLPIGDGAAQFRQTVAQAQRHHFVSRLLQMGDHIVFGAPLFDLFLGRAFQGVRRHQGRMHQHQGARLFTPLTAPPAAACDPRMTQPASLPPTAARPSARAASRARTDPIASQRSIIRRST